MNQQSLQQQVNDLKSSLGQKLDDTKAMLEKRIDDTSGKRFDELKAFLEKRLDDTKGMLEKRIDDKTPGLLAQLPWPIVILVLVLVTWFSGLRTLVPRLTTIRIYKDGPEILIRDLEASLDQEIKKTVDSLERMFPPGKADKYLPSPHPDLDYYVHVVEFLDTLRVPLTSPAVWNAVGAYYFIRDQEKSRRAFERAMALDPNDPSAYTTLGMWHHLNSRDQNAARARFTESIVRAAAKMIPCPWAHVGLAAVARDTNEVARMNSETQLAQQQFQQALAADPTDYWSWHGLGWCKFHQMDFPQARQFMAKATQLMPGFDAAHYNLACLYARVNRPADAVAQLQLLVEEAKIKLEYLGGHREEDFQPIRNDPTFTQFLATFNLVYNP